MQWMDTLQELQTIEVLDIWNQEFGGIDIDWTGFGAFLNSKNDGDTHNNGEELVEKENNLKAKRGRPRLKLLKPEVLSLRRDVTNLEYILNLLLHFSSLDAPPKEIFKTTLFELRFSLF